MGDREGLIINQIMSSHCICTYLPQLTRAPAYIANLSLLIVYLFRVLLFFNYLYIFFPLHCWEGPVSKHFTIGLHLLFTKYVTNNILFDVQ